ncbi:SGNH/GDSL hydrolase family protein [Tundrisphaera lichenicola]|uniref:SGNH/GDSL hydrolase family protein n=1 Tax=Tundrisphaera lichenicola TaxID=2029860 RepID=UPI003EB9A1CA
MPNSSRSAPPIALALLLAWGLAPPGMAPGWTARVREALRSDFRNDLDTQTMERGYYEELVDTGRRFDRLAVPEAPPTDFGPLMLPVDDVREYVIKPNISSTHRGAVWTTNDRGMRDRNYPINKPANTFRIAMTGDSIGAGWGVDDEHGFEPIWERTLDERSRASGGPAVEILNHAVHGHAPGQRWEHFRREGWAASPDLVLFEGTPADLGWDDRELRTLLPGGIGWDAPSYQEALQRSGLLHGGDEPYYRQALRPHREALLAGVYRRVARDCQARGVPSVWLLLPRVGKPVSASDRSSLVGMARSAGFSAVVDLSDAFDGLAPESLAIAPDDYHPNAEGHALLAGRIDEQLQDFVKIPQADSNPEGDPR